MSAVEHEAYREEPKKYQTSSTSLYPNDLWVIMLNKSQWNLRMGLIDEILYIIQCTPLDITSIWLGSIFSFTRVISSLILYFCPVWLTQHSSATIITKNNNLNPGLNMDHLYNLNASVLDLLWAQNFAL